MRAMLGVGALLGGCSAGAITGLGGNIGMDGGPGTDAGSPDADTFHESLPLPVLVIDTGGQSIVQDVKIDATMYAVQDHDGTLDGLAAGLADRPRTFDGRIGIEIRGATSAGFPKKSYGLEIRDGAGQDIDVALLGMPPEADWVLHGPYSDKSLMRNRLAYDLGRALGRYQPRARYVELLIDGQYRGVYVLVEKIKRGPHRVPIPKVAQSAATGDITGGYIIKREGSGQNTGWFSARGTPWEYHYPKHRDITAEQAAYIQSHVDAFEAAMQGPAFADPERGYAAWIDVPSFVDFAIITELSRNVDGYRKSSYMYKTSDAQGGLFHMGPLWDFNLAFGNADYCGGHDTEGFQYLDARCNEVYDEIPAWWRRLMQDARFTTALRCRWEELRRGVLANSAIAERMAAYRAVLVAAEPRDHATWGNIGVYTWPNPFVGDTYDDDVDYLSIWIAERAAWLDENLPGECP